VRGVVKEELRLCKVGKSLHVNGIESEVRGKTVRGSYLHAARSLGIRVSTEIKGTEPPYEVIVTRKN
jgi:hypothetical protein